MAKSKNKKIHSVLSKPFKDTNNKTREKPTVSLCMIVKDEEKNLNRCLESIKGLTDEIIVVDTGSKDATIRIAQDNGAKVYSLQWNNDFSEARNFSLSYATKNWILVMDADEALPKEQHPKLLHLIATSQFEAYTVRIKSRIKKDTDEYWVINTHTRLFRNHSGIKFSGRVHEDIRPSVEAIGASIGMGDVEIVHYGYSVDVVHLKEKAQRNIALLQQTIRENPDNALSYFYLGEAYSLSEEWSSAVESYRRSLQKENLNTAYRGIVHQNLATALLHLKKWEEARIEARKAFKRDSRLTAPYLIAGSSAFDEGIYDLAIFYLTAYLDHGEEIAHNVNSSPLNQEINKPFAYELLGRACFHTNNYDGAMKWFDSWEREVGQKPDVLVWKARISLAEKKFREAEILLGKALDDNPHFVEAHLQMGLLMVELHNSQKALNYFHQALAHEPASWRVRVEIGRLYFTENRFNDACVILEEALHLNKNYVVIGPLLAEAYARAGRRSEANELLWALRSMKQVSSKAEFLAGTLAKEAGDVSAAASAFRKAIQSEDQPPEFYYACGNALIELQQYKDAIAAYQKTIVLAPTVKEPYHNLAVAHIKLEEYLEAIAIFEYLIKLEPGAKQIKRMLAGLYGKIGEHEIAERYLYEAGM
ncbi:MAG: tetratricopeptide repeat protein [Patescibacteria group bacterium]|nr:tetratricopeptide repeat protein [Patescibacteria group bacterium]